MITVGAFREKQKTSENMNLIIEVVVKLCEALEKKKTVKLVNPGRVESLTDITRQEL